MAALTAKQHDVAMNPIYIQNIKIIFVATARCHNQSASLTSKSKKKNKKMKRRMKDRKKERKREDRSKEEFLKFDKWVFADMKKKKFFYIKATNSSR